MTSDYLRQRALYALQDLVTRFLTEDALAAGPSGPLVSQLSSHLGTQSVSMGERDVCFAGSRLQGFDRGFTGCRPLGSTGLSVGHSIQYGGRGKGAIDLKKCIQIGAQSSSEGTHIL